MYWVIFLIDFAIKWDKINSKKNWFRFIMSCIFWDDLNKNWFWAKLDFIIEKNNSDRLNRKILVLIHDELTNLDQIKWFESTGSCLYSENNTIANIR